MRSINYLVMYDQNLDLCQVDHVLDMLKGNAVDVVGYLGVFGVYNPLR